MMVVSDVSLKTVAYVTRVIPHYRADFLNSLEKRLKTASVQLTVFADFAEPESYFLDGLSDVSCAVRVRNRYWKFARKLARIRIPYWQPLMGPLRKFDLVVLGQSNAALVIYPLILRRRVFGAPPKLAFWGHGKNLQKDEIGLQRWLKTSLAQHVDHWFVFTELSGEIVRQLSVREDIITVVNNSIDTSDLTSAATMDRAAKATVRARFRIGEGPVAVFCGRLAEQKALPFIVEACRVARKSLPDLTLVVIGDGPVGPWLRNQAEKEPWIRPLGAMYGAEKGTVLVASDVFLLPSMVGLSILDGFAAGLPVLVARFRNHSPEVAYLDPGVNGLMSEATVEDYALAITKVLSDADLRERMGMAARQSAKTYSLDAMVENFASGIEQALS